MNLSGEPAAHAALALYVHWPFCVSKCPYCDFNSHVRASIDEEEWRAALLADLAHEARLLPGRKLTSIFFGGGTPSLMSPWTAAAIIEAACRHWVPADDIEITLEANPNSVETRSFTDFSRLGVNRVSLGIQSLNDERLQFLGRAHSTREALEALDLAKYCFDRVSFDLIYALPGQDRAEWARMLRRAIDYKTDHLSLYQLTIEPGTRFAALHAAGKFEPLDSERAADLFEITQGMTEGYGIPAYEISNHARPGQESRHNLTYWRYGDYVGIGPGAHGRRLGMRTVRHRKPENFLSALERNGHGISEEARLSEQESADEALVMGLRLAEGIDAAALAARFGFDALVDWSKVDRLAASGHVVRAGSHIALTAPGRLLLDYILGEIAVPSAATAAPMLESAPAS